MPGKSSPLSPELVGITSFNEWHEGTQIEPAVPKHNQGFTYLDYQPLSADYYLKRTAYWIRQWQPGRQTAFSSRFGLLAGAAEAQNPPDT